MDFDSSRSSVVRSFAERLDLKDSSVSSTHEVSESSGVDQEEVDTPQAFAACFKGGSLWARWTDTASKEQPTDFGFLVDKLQPLMSPGSPSSTRSSSRSRSPSKSSFRIRRGSSDVSSDAQEISSPHQPTTAPRRSDLLPEIIAELSTNSAEEPTAPSRPVVEDSLTVERSGWSSDKTLQCKFWLKGACKRRDCKFAHGEPEQRQACRAVMCQYFINGGCRQGNLCWYAHSTPSPEVTKSQELTRSLGRACTDGADSQLAQGPWRQPEASAIATSAREPASLHSSSTDKTLLCKFWMRRQCTKNENCKFAHGEEEQRAACKLVLCRFEKNGTCRQGAQCWYAHSMPEPPGSSSDTGVEDSASASTGLARRPSGTQNAPALQTAMDSTMGSCRLMQVGMQPEIGNEVKPALTKLSSKRVCKFWLKGRCMREDCKYAHVEQEQQRASTINSQDPSAKCIRQRIAAHSDSIKEESMTKSIDEVADASTDGKIQSSLSKWSSPSHSPWSTPLIGPDRLLLRWSELEDSDEDDDMVPLPRTGNLI